MVSVNNVTQAVLPKNLSENGSQVAGQYQASDGNTYVYTQAYARSCSKYGKTPEQVIELVIQIARYSKKDPQKILNPNGNKCEDGEILLDARDLFLLDNDIQAYVFGTPGQKNFNFKVSLEGLDEGDRAEIGATDVNEDGVIDESEIVCKPSDLVIQYAKQHGLTEADAYALAEEIGANGDINGDGRIDLKELFLAPSDIQEKYFGTRDLTLEPTHFCETAEIEESKLEEELGLRVGYLDDARAANLLDSKKGFKAGDVITESLVEVGDPPPEIPVADMPYYNIALDICEMLRRDGVNPDVPPDELYLTIKEDFKDGSISLKEWKSYLPETYSRVHTKQAYKDFGIGEIHDVKELEARFDELNLLFKVRSQYGYTFIYHITRTKFIKYDQSFLADPGSKTWNMYVNSLPDGDPRKARAMQMEVEWRKIAEEAVKNNPSLIQEGETREDAIERMVNEWKGMFFINLVQQNYFDPNKIWGRKRIDLPGRSDPGMTNHAQDIYNSFFEAMIWPHVLEPSKVPPRGDRSEVETEKKYSFLTLRNPSSLKGRRKNAAYLTHFKKLPKILGDKKYEKAVQKWAEDLLGKLEKQTKEVDGEQVTVYVLKDEEGNVVREYTAEQYAALQNLAANPFSVDFDVVAYRETEEGRKKGFFVFDMAYKLYKAGDMDGAGELLLSLPEANPNTVETVAPVENE